MDIYHAIDMMLLHINKRNWASLESEYRQLGVCLAGPEMANAIAAIDTEPYEAALQRCMASAYERAERVSGKAIYFEYDLDNSWQSNFFICQDYNTLAAEDEDWACDWVAEVKGPEFRIFSDLYNQTPGFDDTDFDKGTTLYLIARTIAAFGRSAEQFLDKDYVLCIAFHDQNPIMRIKESHV